MTATRRPSTRRCRLANAWIGGSGTSASGASAEALPAAPGAGSWAAATSGDPALTSDCSATTPGDGASSLEVPPSRAGSAAPASCSTSARGRVSCSASGSGSPPSEAAGSAPTWSSLTSQRWCTRSCTRYCSSVVTGHGASSLRSPRRPAGSGGSDSTAAASVSAQARISPPTVSGSSSWYRPACAASFGSQSPKVGSSSVRISASRSVNRRSTSRVCAAYSSGDQTCGSGRSRTSPRSSSTGQTCTRSEEHTSELQSRGHLVCRLLLETKNEITNHGKLVDRPCSYWLYLPSVVRIVMSRPPTIYGLL